MGDFAKSLSERAISRHPVLCRGAFGAARVDRAKD